MRRCTSYVSTRNARTEGAADGLVHDTVQVRVHTLDDAVDKLEVPESRLKARAHAISDLVQAESLGRFKEQLVVVEDKEEDRDDLQDCTRSACTVVHRSIQLTSW